ncbi:MAG: transporter [Micrococcales bacterium]|nr:MAG: transporter [Micrococcales bacterium]PIE26943.1 MAG: transporter [Micrococcales bacterium]
MSTTVWVVTVALILGLLAFDYFFHVRTAHTPTLREAAVWSAVYVGLAILFGIAVWVFGGQQEGTEYAAGYITEKALSVDNLFVFLIIMGSFKVPRAHQQKVLLFGIVFALVARTACILAGAALINRFSWVFYIFGFILLITAGNLLKGQGQDAEADNFIIRFARKHLKTTDFYDGDRLFTVVGGKRMMTPMLLVMVAIGGTDTLFALDSIPAIFGLTQNPYIVFTATAFSLMGLRQLYFLVDGLLDRLVYLSYGLVLILAFIAVKLVLHALHENTLPFINAGEHVNVAEVSIELSLAVIAGTLLVTVAASMYSPKGKALTTVNNVRRHTKEYLDLNFEADQTRREKNYLKLLDEEAQLRNLDGRYLKEVDDYDRVLGALEQAHRVHDRYIAEHPEIAAQVNQRIAAHEQRRDR